MSGKCRLSGQNIILTYPLHCPNFRYMSNRISNKTEEFAEIFQVLSNANRLRIFLRLASCCKPGTVGLLDDDDDDGCTAYVGELGESLNVVKSTVSHHIKELRRVGLIRTERRGQKVACWVDPEILDELKDFFSF